MTLVSGSRLTDPQNAALGPIWRVKYPSRFERDALCCDILLPSHGPAKTPYYGIFRDPQKNPGKFLAYHGLFFMRFGPFFLKKRANDADASSG